MNRQGSRLKVKLYTNLENRGNRLRMCFIRKKYTCLVFLNAHLPFFPASISVYYGWQTVWGNFSSLSAEAF